MTEEEYEELLERIKFDLYKEFIDPETATYGIKYAEDKEEKSLISISDLEASLSIVRSTSVLFFESISTLNLAISEFIKYRRNNS